MTDVGAHARFVLLTVREVFKFNNVTNNFGRIGKIMVSL